MAQFNFYREMSEIFSVAEGEIRSNCPESVNGEIYRDLLGTISGTSLGHMEVPEKVGRAVCKVLALTPSEEPGKLFSDFLGGIAVKPGDMWQFAWCFDEHQSEDYYLSSVGYEIIRFGFLPFEGGRFGVELWSEEDEVRIDLINDDICWCRHEPGAMWVDWD